MSVEAENLRAELRAAIAETDDAHTRALLLLMQGLYDITAAGFQQAAQIQAEGFQTLNDKIDSVLNNEKELREKVLNGHAPDFDETMKWVKAEMLFSPRQKHINRWVEERMQNNGYCDYAAEKMKQEEKEAENSADSKRRIRDAVIEKVLIGVISSASTAVGLWMFFKV
jgi:ATP-dependent Lon protease